MAIREKQENQNSQHGGQASNAGVGEKGSVPETAVSVIRLVDSLILNAYEARASDIHIDPAEHNIIARFRIDGVLHDSFNFKKELQSEIITRIKIISGMRTDEHQAAQDGRFKLQVKEGEFVDVRVSVAPTYYGENCVMRLLSGKSQGFTLDRLGFSPSNLEKIKKAMKKPYGMILATGPTGSGKTTTLYSILGQLNTRDVSIITIEDPIEYSIEGIDQVQVHSRTGLTFAEGLRFILRQDPNIIMVGEIRDNETASIAVNAAMTGHQLLSTLHTNDAATTLPRLLDMGVEPFLIASTINVAIGQRLVRKLCDECRAERTLKPEEIESLRGTVPDSFLQNLPDLSVGLGCNKCGKTGFLGRVGIHEVLEISEETRSLIMKRADASVIRDAAIKAGMIPMLEDGLDKVKQGITTIEEVLRVFHE
ncbi:MAG: type II secretion system protein GspE [Candidatus Harrisonbacteria bacterium CG10_big_fil_rev_8_21_14_0_10_40_38]|uniref:Type II secretion system protein GspE n=1 Tax=Candidatus Harrisonbacteria bacterium CG10_big_fil_rev_8_21_14_0_10_40_38 TaxID=1974583 RepID=A0A2H0UUX2_9BACT|nr:MAG: type II secretion system protein GspE [Candidatus Harrisonbacteria bacterium CG10_big_fil_rev_8_21_14_0_10_40_38]